MKKVLSPQDVRDLCRQIVAGSALTREEKQVVKLLERFYLRQFDHAEAAE